MIYYDWPMEQYLAYEGFSSSLLRRAVTETMADFKAAWDNKDFEETRFTVLGSAIHTAILEPDFLDIRYALQPADWGPRNVGEGYKKWNAFKKENSELGRQPIGWEDAEIIRRVKHAADWNDALAGLLAHGRPEVTAIHEDSIIKYKARTDLLVTPSNEPIAMWDIKTTSENLADENLFNIIFKNGYHFQFAHHTFCFENNGVPISEHGWILVSTRSSAVHIRLVKCPPELIKWGKRDHEYAMNRLQKALESDEWPGYSSQVILDIPEWGRRLYE